MSPSPPWLVAVQVLLMSGADVNVTEDQTLITPLFLAAHEGHLEAVKLLMQSGADAHATNGAGLTAAEVAEANGFGEVAKCITDHVKEQADALYRERHRIAVLGVRLPDWSHKW
jgi:ankyrin repeat protein